ncbi:MAG: type II toxin-antitoxin system VapC family toxin [Armatimonadota bacterium]|nr:type II toxin-antitoxin system VapC family toxin [Armatimonadota bacterium]
MGILIDSTVFIEAERGRLHLDRYLAAQEGEPVAISAVTASELLHGVHRAASPSARAQREGFVEAILSRFPVAEFDLQAARIHARLWAQVMKKRQAVGAHDLLIGATAVALGFQVATTDVREFQRIPGLRVQLWAS